VRPLDHEDGEEVTAMAAAHKPFDARSCALLIVDMQQALFERPFPVYGGEELLGTIRSLAERAHEGGALVVFVQHCNSMMPHGSAAWRLHASLRPVDGDLLIEKEHHDAFEGTGLAAELAARSVSIVLVTGLVTHGCIGATCRGGVALGLDVVLVSDAHSNVDRRAAKLIADWNAALKSEVGGVLRARDIRFERAGGPAHRHDPPTGG
jgi:nicotinamidase-related amidase